MENTITGNLKWTIENFKNNPKGLLTFPTKFDMVDDILSLDHNGKVIVRMSLNPKEIIQAIEIGTSPLENRVKAINKLKQAGYKIGILIAPVILVEDWKSKYTYKKDTRKEAEEYLRELMKKYFPQNEIKYIV